MTTKSKSSAFSVPLITKRPTVHKKVSLWEWKSCDFGGEITEKASKIMTVQSEDPQIELSEGVEWAHGNCDIHNFMSRSELPSTAAQRESISLWSILKQSIGKDLSRITMPVVFNEPLSFIQRLAEYLEYSHILKAADQQTDAINRLEHVAAFACSSLACNWERIAKPFNPLLCETYELSRPDLSFEFVAEQVSHHPPVSAFYCRGPHFEYYGSVHPKLKFWGRAVQVEPKGVHTLVLKRHNETYTWSGVNCSVHNLVMGKMYLEQDGVMEILCHSNGLKCVLNFKPSSGWFGKDTSDHIVGHIIDKNKSKLRALYGEWTSFLASCPVDVFDKFFQNWTKDYKEHRNRKEKLSTKSLSLAGEPTQNGDCEPRKQTKMVMPVVCGSRVLWNANPRPECSEDYYHFTYFAMILNEQCDGAKLPPTDSRKRPDIRLMEHGNMDQAATEKHRLEEKQREANKSNKKGEHQAPLWFVESAHPLVKEDTWIFTGKYFDKNWQKCPDIF